MFIKITKTKVLAAYGQIIDVLFANKKFPIVVESSPLPEGIAEFAHLDVAGRAAQEQPQGQSTLTGLLVTEGNYLPALQKHSL